MEERTQAVQELLERASAAHHVFETEELGGVYDDAWPEWYGRWAVENGLASILGHDVTGEDVGSYFGRTWAESQAGDPKPAEPWAVRMARRIVAEL